MKIKINYYLCSVINEGYTAREDEPPKQFKQLIMARVKEVQIKVETSIGEVTIKEKPNKK